MLVDILEERLRERHARSLARSRRTRIGPSAGHPLVSDSAVAREVLAFCSNDYLGLAAHPAINAALIEGVQRYGSGSGASHLISGHTEAHEALEHQLAEFVAHEIPNARAVSFSTGYMANIALMTALADKRATIFFDKLNHASLVDGALLSDAKLERYAHQRLDMLEAKLAACASPVKLIVTDGVFSMDGDLARLPELSILAERFDAWIVVDDAHGFGVLGPHGRGALAHFELRDRRLIYMATLGKAAGVAGAFIAAHPSIVEWIVQTARSYVYTTAAPPALAHALSTSLRIIAGGEGDTLRMRLNSAISDARARLEDLLERHAQLRWRLAESTTAIQPLIVGSSDAALALSHALDARGVWIPAIRPPTVPAGSARLRIALSAAHREADLDRLQDALHAVARASTA